MLFSAEPLKTLKSRRTPYGEWDFGSAPLLISNPLHAHKRAVELVVTSPPYVDYNDYDDYKRLRPEPRH